MKKFKALNLYACLGGNRYKWDEVAKEAGIDLEVAAVELDPELARMYQERFPNDEVIIGDAHAYLLHNYRDFDFIWSSPPCPTHSRLNTTITANNNGQARYADMTLYQEIILLQNWFKGFYCVENVIPYYKPLIPAKQRGRHLYWSNFNLPNDLNERVRKDFTRVKNREKYMSEFHGIDLTNYKGKQEKRKIACNLVDYEAGRTIFETALGIIKKSNVKQGELF